MTFCPGMNHVTVAEQTLGLLLALTRQIPQHDAIVKRGEWHRGVGRELAEETLGLWGWGAPAGRSPNGQWPWTCGVCASADVTWDEAFAHQWGISRQPTAEEVLQHADVVSLHMNLPDDIRATSTRHAWR